MASFTDTLRASTLNRYTRLKERQARLQGRPLTQEEETAPYSALAETAGSRLAQAKTLQMQEEGLKQNERLQTERLEASASEAEKNRQIELQRIDELRRQAEETAGIQREQLAITKKGMEEELRAAELARENEKKWEPLQMALGIGSGLSIFSNLIFGSSSGGLLGGITKIFG